MANIYEPTPEQEKGWVAWAAGRPKVIQDLAARFKPWKLYLLKSSGHRVFLLSFNESNTITVAVTGKYNLVSMERQVFGIQPEDLEECELPDPGTPLGVFLTEEEQLDMINRRRHEHGIGSIDLAEFRRMREDSEGYCVVGGEHAGEPLDDPPQGR
jgi:hypothetical protein